MSKRRAFLLIGWIGALALLLAVVYPLINRAAQELKLPLRHEDIIRQQSAQKRLDPSLVAAVIYAESKFHDRTSVAGARGLMQILPETARFIAQRSGGTRFTDEDLASPQINIAYGSYYLRYLIDRYGGNEMLAVAAYNAGETNVDRWIVRAGREGRDFRTKDISFSETRAYVERVWGARDNYRETYSRELGLKR